MDGVFLDTHVLIWYLSSPDSLTPKEMHAIDSAVQKGNCLYISSITIVEIIYLVEKGKIPEEALEMLLQATKDTFSELRILPIDLHVATELRNVPREKVPDMPDRLIAASAQCYNMPLITRDQKIRNAGLQII